MHSAESGIPVLLKIINMVLGAFFLRLLLWILLLTGKVGEFVHLQSVHPRRKAM